MTFIPAPGAPQQPLNRGHVGRGLIVAAICLLPSGVFAQVTVGPPIRIDVGGSTFAANETTVSASDANPLEIIAGWNDWRRSGSSELINAAFSLSMDGGQTWTDFLIRPPTPNQSGVEGDPMTAADPRTGTLWAGAISFSAGSNSGIFVARKDPGETTFHPAVMARTSNGTDKCWMAAGPRPGLPDTTRLYVAYNEGVIWSDNMGDTWTSPVSLGSGLGFLPRIGPNGELYIVYWDGGTGMKLKRSYNGGQNFTTHTVATRLDVWGTQDGSRFPGWFRVPSMLYLAVDQNTGTLYAAYFDTTNVVMGQHNVNIYFTKSTDQGTNWTTPVVINGDWFPPGDQFFCWLEADAYGHLHMVFLDSRRTQQNDDTEHGMFDAYYSFSSNGGDTWTEYRLTATKWDSANDGLDRSNQFLGDYLGLAVIGDAAYPVYLDTSSGDPDIYVRIVQTGLKGDMNCDGVIDTEDVEPFVMALVDPAAYQAAYPACQILRGDMDSNGGVDGADIAGFLEVLLAQIVA